MATTYISRTYYPFFKTPDSANTRDRGKIEINKRFWAYLLPTIKTRAKKHPSSLEMTERLMPKKLPLQADLKRLFVYDRDTGSLTWRIKHWVANPGDDAGTVRKDGFVTVSVNARLVAATRLIWCYEKGYWPNFRLALKNGNRQDLRWNNIQPKRLSMKKASVYQRALAKLNERALDKIFHDKEDLSLRYEYMHGGPEGQRRALRKARAEIRYKDSTAFAKAYPLYTHDQFADPEDKDS